MKRTQIYITDDQDRRLGEIARARSIAKAEVVREILDGALSPDRAEAEAAHVLRATAGICKDYPDWPEWLSSVRGDGAGERLRSLGL